MNLITAGFEMLGPMEDNPALFLVKRDDRLFRVSTASWEVIDGISSGKNDDAIARDIGTYFTSGVVDALRLAKIKAHVASQLVDNSVPRKTVQLWGTVDLVGQDNLGSLVESLPIFPRDVRLFYPLLAVFATANIAFVALAHDILSRVSGAPLSRETLIQSVVVFIAMFVIMVLHELSHATAVSRFGLRPARIGAGFFLIFPALFADVSEIWRLRSSKRIVVNLAGVFAQLWIGVLFAAALLVAPTDWVPALGAVYVVNLATLTMNLIPFAKLDGYWVLADAIGCADLHASAFQALARVVGRGKAKERKAPAQESALILFGVAHIAFYGAVALFAVTAVTHFVAGVSQSPEPFLFVEHSFGQHPIGFVTSAFVIYRLLKLAVKIFSATTGDGR